MPETVVEAEHKGIYGISLLERPQELLGTHAPQRIAETQ